MFSVDSQNNEPILADRPAPLTPDLQSAINWEVSAIPRSSKGKKPNCVAVG